jgi:hypothetical protein
LRGSPREGQVKALDHDQPAHAVPPHRGDDRGGALLQNRRVARAGAADGADDGIGALDRTPGRRQVPDISGGHRHLRVIPVELARRAREGMDLASGRAGLPQDGPARPAGRPEQCQSHLLPLRVHARLTGRRAGGGASLPAVTLGSGAPGRHTRKVVFPQVAAAFNMTV